MPDTSRRSDVAARLCRASTFLFVPGNRPSRFESAWGSTADAVILDLEASVHPSDKYRARLEVSDWIRKAPDTVAVLVRLNRLGTEEVARDLETLEGMEGIALMCSGAELGPDLDALLQSVTPTCPVVLLVETALGVEQANTLATLPGVCRLAFGNMDYATELDLGPESAGLVYPSSKLVVASKCAGLPAPIAGVTADIHRREVIDSDLRFERSLGFGAKMCIHPVQLEAARAAFEPSEEECAWANRIISATNASHAVSIDGQMIDRPVVERAERIIARSQQKK